MNEAGLGATPKRELCHAGLGRQRKIAALTFLAVAAAGCDPATPLGGTAGSGGAAGSSGASGASAGGSLSGITSTRTSQLRVSAARAGAGAGGTAGASGGVGTSGAAGAGGVLFACVPNLPPGSPPAIAICGDGFRASTEECDDRNTSNADACSASCTVTPRLVDQRVPTLADARALPSRTLGASRHPLAAGCNRVGVSFVDQTSEPPSLRLATYDTSGVPGSTFRFGTSTVDFPDTSVAALPGDSFALAWTDLGEDGDELGVQLGLINPTLMLQPPARVANEGTAFSQSAPDLVFDGKELVVAWRDDADPVTAPDIHYRLFAPDLSPLTGDLVLAGTSAVEGDVALAAFNGGWAAAWRSGSALGLETIEVQSGALHWTVGPFLPGLAGDRPDLTMLDATHLALAFTEGTDPNGTGIANVSRLHGAILDAAAPGQVASFAIPPAQDPYSSSPALDQSQPALALFPDHLQVSWRSGALSGDPKDSELWSRRVPFSVAADHSVTIGPSHVEVPLVRNAAQRVGDQSAFRLLSSNAWPSGGLVAAWQDYGRSFQGASGNTDVAVQFLADLVEPPPAVTPYAVSADGKYYNVNLLRRNYAPPVASATFANDAVQYAVYGPALTFDGDDVPFQWTTPTAADPDATVRLVVDLGGYFSLGAVRPLYRRDGQFNPVTHGVRVATVPGNWTTAVQPTAVTATDTTLSFDAQPARFVELTMVGTNSAAAAVAELFIYPSAQTSPPPTSASGYDLGYLATSKSNNNLFAPGARFPMSWPAGNFAGKTLAQGGTGDGVGIVDFGAQYTISRLALCFAYAATWMNGGRLEVAAIPDTYNTLYDSGVGSTFGPVINGCQEYSFPLQPVRYVRTTDYFLAGAGPSGNVLWSVQAFTTPAPVTSYFPLGSDGKFFNVNLLRRPAGAPQATASAVYANGALTYTPDVSQQNPTNAIDGDDKGFLWWTPSGANPDATVTLTVDLGQVVSVGAISTSFNSLSVSTSLRAAQAAGAWTQVLPDAPAVNGYLSFDAVSARYLELTFKGTTGAKIAGVNEIGVFPSSATVPAPSSASQLDLTYLPGLSITTNANMLGGGGTGARFQQTYFTGKSVAQGATGDGTITFDLGAQYQISQINLQYYLDRIWPGGGKLEVDDGTGAWSTVYDSGRGNPMGVIAGVQPVLFSKRQARFIRATDYFIPGVGTSPGGLLMNLEVF